MLDTQAGLHGRTATTVRATGGSINLTRVLFAVLLVVIGIAAISAIVYAVSIGQPNIALIIGLVSAAFFARVGC